MAEDAGDSGTVFAADGESTGALERYRALVNAVDAGLCQLDGDNRFVAVNEAVERLTGYDRAALLGTHVSTVLAPGDVARLEAMIHSMVHDGLDATPLEVPLQTADGATVPCEVQLSLLAGDEDPAGTVAVIRDLRPREGDRAAATEWGEESLVREVLDGAGVGVIVRDAEDTVAWINEATEAYFGVDRGAVIGADLDTLVDEHLGPAVAEPADLGAAIRGAVETEESFDCQVLPGDGRRHRWLRHRSNPIETGRYAGGRVDVYHDVTEETQSKRVARDRKQQLTEERAFTDSLLDAQADMVYAIDTEGRPLRWNDEVLDATGYSEAELAWMHALDLIAEEAHDEAIAAMDRVLEHGEQITVELPLVTDAGERVPYQFTGAPLTNDDGEIVGLTGVGRDISTLRAQAERLERQRDELEEQLADVFERVDDAVVAIDDGFRLTYLNDSAADLLRVDAAAALGSDVREADPWADRVVETIREAFETQEPLSVEAYYPRLEAWFDHRVYPSETGASVYFRDVTERERRERELEAQRERLAALDDLNGVVRDITDAVLGQSTREEIEEVVVGALAASDSYEGAWIGEPDPDADTIHPRAEAGADPDGLAVALGPGAGESPIRRAAETKTLQVAGEAAAADDEGAGVARAAAIPIVHEETLYGVLTVHAARADAFSDEEREVIGQLGEIVGHAIAALERKRALMSDEVTEIEFRIADVFGDLDVAGPVDGITFDRTVPAGEERFHVYGSATETGYGVLEALVEQRDMAREVRIISTEGDRHAIELQLDEPPLLSTVATHGGNVTEARIADGDYHLTVQLPPGAPVRQLRDVVDATYGDATFVAQRQVRRPTDRTERVLSALTEELTERQRVVVETAYQAGYFEWPRASNGEDIATTLDISPATFSQHLRKAERRLFGVLLGDREPPAE